MADLEFTGDAALVAALQRIAAKVKDDVPAAFADQITREIESRDRRAGGREPLTIEVKGSEVRVGWPYPSKGATGSYITRTVEAAARLMEGPFGRRLSQILEP